MFDLTAVTDTETGLVAVFIQSAQSIADIESIAFQRSSVFHAGNNAAGGRILTKVELRSRALIYCSWRPAPSESLQ